MKLGIANLTELDWATRTALEDFEVQAQTGWNEEHHEDGSHKAVFADALASNDGNPLPVDSGLRVNVGPLIFESDILSATSGVGSVCRAATITANQNDYLSSGIHNAIILEISSDSARTITGITRRQPWTRRFLWVVNRGNFTITFAHNSSSSNGGNRIAVAGDLDYGLRSGGVAFLYYDSGTEIWRLDPGVATSGVIHRDVTSAEIVNTTGEESVAVFDVPANTLGTNRMIRLTVIGDYLNNSGAGASITFRIKYGGTALLAWAPTATTNANRRNVSIVANLSAANATNAQRGMVHGTMSDAIADGSAAPAIDNPPATFRSSLAIDSTADQEMSVSVEHNTASANISFICRAVQAELV